MARPPSGGEAEDGRASAAKLNGDQVKGAKTQRPENAGEEETRDAGWETKKKKGAKKSPGDVAATKDSPQPHEPAQSANGHSADDGHRGARDGGSKRAIATTPGGRGFSRPGTGNGYRGGFQQGGRPGHGHTEGSKSETAGESGPHHPVDTHARDNHPLSSDPAPPHQTSRTGPMPRRGPPGPQGQGLNRRNPPPPSSSAPSTSTHNHTHTPRRPEHKHSPTAAPPTATVPTTTTIPTPAAVPSSVGGGDLGAVSAPAPTPAAPVTNAWGKGNPLTSKTTTPVPTTTTTTSTPTSITTASAPSVSIQAAETRGAEEVKESKMTKGEDSVSKNEKQEKAVAGGSESASAVVEGGGEAGVSAVQADQAHKKTGSRNNKQQRRRLSDEKEKEKEKEKERREEEKRDKTEEGEKKENAKEENGKEKEKKHEKERAPSPAETAQTVSAAAADGVEGMHAAAAGDGAKPNGDGRKHKQQGNKKCGAKEKEKKDEKEKERKEEKGESVSATGTAHVDSTANTVVSAPTPSSSPAPTTAPASTPAHSTQAAKSQTSHAHTQQKKQQQPAHAHAQHQHAPENKKRQEKEKEKGASKQDRHTEGRSEKKEKEKEKREKNENVNAPTATAASAQTNEVTQVVAQKTVVELVKGATPAVAAAAAASEENVKGQKEGNAKGKPRNRNQRKGGRESPTQEAGTQTTGEGHLGGEEDAEREGEAEGEVKETGTGEGVGVPSKRVVYLPREVVELPGVGVGTPLPYVQFGSFTLEDTISLGIDVAPDAQPQHHVLDIPGFPHASKSPKSPKSGLRNASKAPSSPLPHQPHPVGAPGSGPNHPIGNQHSSHAPIGARGVRTFSPGPEMPVGGPPTVGPILPMHPGGPHPPIYGHPPPGGPRMHPPPLPEGQGYYMGMTMRQFPEFIPQAMRHQRGQGPPPQRPRMPMPQIPNPEHAEGGDVASSASPPGPTPATSQQQQQPQQGGAGVHYSPLISGPPPPHGTPLHVHPRMGLPGGPHQLGMPVPLPMQPPGYPPAHTHGGYVSPGHPGTQAPIPLGHPHGHRGSVGSASAGGHNLEEQQTPGGVQGGKQAGGGNQGQGSGQDKNRAGPATGPLMSPYEGRTPVGRQQPGSRQAGAEGGQYGMHSGSLAMQYGAPGPYGEGVPPMDHAGAYYYGPPPPGAVPPGSPYPAAYGPGGYYAHEPDMQDNMYYEQYAPPHYQQRAPAGRDGTRHKYNPIQQGGGNTHSHGHNAHNDAPASRGGPGPVPTSTPPTNPPATSPSTSLLAAAAVNSREFHPQNPSSAREFHPQNPSPNPRGATDYHPQNAPHSRGVGPNAPEFYPQNQQGPAMNANTNPREFTPPTSGGTGVSHGNRPISQPGTPQQQSVSLSNTTSTTQVGGGGGVGAGAGQNQHVHPHPPHHQHGQGPPFYPPGPYYGGYVYSGVPQQYPPYGYMPQGASPYPVPPTEGVYAETHPSGLITFHKPPPPGTVLPPHAYPAQPRLPMHKGKSPNAGPSGEQYRQQGGDHHYNNYFAGPTS